MTAAKDEFSRVLREEWNVDKIRQGMGMTEEEFRAWLWAKPWIEKVLDGDLVKKN